MWVFGTTIIIKLPIDGKIKFGSHRELLIPLRVESNTMKISSVNLDTEKKDFRERGNPSAI